MRLFIATDLDDAAREAMAALQWGLERRARDRSSIKWTRPEQMHVTLAFIGEADEARSAQLIVAMQRRVAQAPFEARFAGVGMFPDRGAPRVLWLGMDDSAAAMAALQREVAARVEGVGVVLEARPFHPHLTLARWRDARPADRRAFDQVSDTGVVARVRVDHATLYRSQLSSGGSIYTPLARVTLSGV
ncbi:MAG TPA: RNA 2',3'-cyclic phosphodiesterase [Vicinamibacterales bacterium]|nr:RNA 2',3'-cyclic phosphodiesterase [Vicinamibacterales bacterium]